MRRFLLLGLGILLSAALPPRGWAADQPEVELRSRPNQVEIVVRGRPFATYVHRDDAIPRPYFAHVRADGIPVTRNHPPREGVDLTDHATFHPGLWLAFGDLGGADSWRNKAPVIHRRFLAPPRSGSEGSFTVENHYLSAPDGDVLAVETCRYSILPRPSGILLIAESSFNTERENIGFGDQEEMGFGVRLATPLTVRNGGRMVDSENRSGERAVRGAASSWCDYSALIDGRHVGLLLMPGPRNFRPSWYHARDYGLLVANPFGRNALMGGTPSRVPLPKGKPLTLTFAVVAHATARDMMFDASAAYHDFLIQLDRPR